MEGTRAAVPPRLRVQYQPQMYEVEHSQALWRPLLAGLGVVLQSVHRLQEPKKRACLLEIGASAGATADSREPLAAQRLPPSPRSPCPGICPAVHPASQPGSSLGISTCSFCKSQRSSRSLRGVTGSRQPGSQRWQALACHIVDVPVAEESKLSATAWKGQRTRDVNLPAPSRGPCPAPVPRSWGKQRLAPSRGWRGFPWRLGAEQERHCRETPILPVHAAGRRELV